MRIPFATQSYLLDAAPLSAQRLVNAYLEKEPEDTKSQTPVLGVPGLSQFATVGTGPIRGLWVLGTTLYVVSGGNLYTVSSSGVATSLGGTISGTGTVSMSDNGTQLVIVNGTNGYIWAPTTGFALISDVNFHAANTVTFFDDVFVFDWAGTNKFFISNTLDGSTYNGLAFATAEVAPSPVLATVNQQETMLIFTGKLIETWYDAGAPIMPFLRVDGGTIERGCAAARTPIKEDNAVFFLGNDLIFYRLFGTQLTRVSTHAVESAWRGYPTVADAFTFSYTFEGHKFINMNFPTANATWVLDLATGRWHERISWDQNSNSLGRWRGNCHATAYGLELIGDAFSNQIGSIDKTNFTEFGNTIQAQYISPPIHDDRRRVFIPRLELDFQAGVGLSAGQGSNPQVMLEWSKDGGVTYSPIQIWNSIGRIGAYLTRLRWLRLGQARQWVFRVTISDPIRRTLMQAHADTHSGMDMFRQYKEG